MQRGTFDVPRCFTSTSRGFECRWGARVLNVPPCAASSGSVDSEPCDLNVTIVQTAGIVSMPRCAGLLSR